MPSQSQSQTQSVSQTQTQTQAPVPITYSTTGLLAPGSYIAPTYGCTVTVLIVGGGGGASRNGGTSAAGGDGAAFKVSFFSDGVTPFNVSAHGQGGSRFNVGGGGYGGGGGGGGATAIFAGGTLLAVAGGGGGAACKAVSDRRPQGLLRYSTGSSSRVPPSHHAGPAGLHRRRRGATGCIGYGWWWD
jgi:hypothetical protein